MEGDAKRREEIRSAVVLGDPAEKIIQFAKENGIDMIVIGSRGLGGVKRSLLGSVSSEVHDLAECKSSMGSSPKAKVERSMA